MTTISKPYFMSNPEWFYYDDNEFRYKLTDKATERATESYREFYGALESMRL